MDDFTSTEFIYQKLTECGLAVCTDTRKILPGSMFFALKGANFDANGFALKALEQGCKFAVVDDPSLPRRPELLLVRDVLTALQDVARQHRRTFRIPVLGITGSNAKTTTKELVHAVLSKRYTTLATEGNLNNHIGVPLTLLKLRKAHTFAVIEMGANHQGEIDVLCKIAEPDFGLITNIGKAHLEGFGGIEGVKKGKSEMYRFLAGKKGKVFLNADDPVLMELAAANDKITFGTSPDHFVTGRDESSGGDVAFRYSVNGGKVKWEEVSLIRTRLSGSYNFVNCLAAVCVGEYFGVSSGEVKAALEAYEPTMNRSQVVKTAGNTVILDAYNANPDSMAAALKNLSLTKAAKKMAILGDMFELGDHSATEHRRIADLARGYGFDKVLLAGKMFTAHHAAGCEVFADTVSLRDYLARLRPKGYLVLLKGSRGMKMETLLDLL